MKAKLDKLEAMQNQAYFESKLQMVPASLKHTYSNLNGKEDTLVARELIVDGRVMIGIEYAPDGSVSSAYTTDQKGKRVNIENAVENKKDHTPKDIISKRLDEVSKTLGNIKETARTDEPVQAPEPKKSVRRELSAKDLKDIENYKNSRRGC